MNHKKLLSYGYFLKELPPPFNSIQFGENIDAIALPKPKIRKPIDFSIPKGKHARRILQLAHPFAYANIAKYLTAPQNWAIVEAHLRKSSCSLSLVKENTKAGDNVANENNRATLTRYEVFSASKRVQIMASFDMMYLLEIDISKYYPTIYTHSISWALLGRSRAKAFLRLKKNVRSAEPDFVTYEFADNLDALIRYGQENHSIGIPIGPDSSHIVSEIIGCYFDERLKLQFPKLKAFRYFDDFTIFVETEEKAQTVLRFVQEILAEFQLSINEQKLNIKRFPFEFEDRWVQEVSRLQLEEVNENQLRHYFSGVFGLANRHPDKSDTIFKYSLRRFERRTTVISDKDFPLFHSLLLKCALVEPSALEIVSRILETYRQEANREQIASVMIKILEAHCPLNHHFEVVWALWILKQFSIVLPRNFVRQIVESNYSLAILMLLDFEATNLIDGGPIDPDDKQLVIDILDSENDPSDWLLHYEAVEVKRWLIANKRSEFDVLLAAAVSFYESSATINIYKRD